MSPSESNATSSSAAPAGAKVDALGRKIWDKSYYADRALLKAGGEHESVEHSIATLLPVPSRRPKVTVPEVRENLKRRTHTIDLTKEVGKSRVISLVAPKWEQGGFYCKICDSLLKDSQAYLDHLNGKKHNRMLGMTMRVEKVDAETVKEKLKRLANRDPMEKKTKEDLEREAQQRIKELEEQERQRKERKRQRKQKIKSEATEDDVDEKSMASFGFPRAFAS